MFGIGTQELLIILVLALIVFGPAKLPEVGRSVGRSLREFRRASEEIKDEFRMSLDDDELPPTPRPAPSSGPAPAKPTEAAAAASDASSGDPDHS